MRQRQYSRSGHGNHSSVLIVNDVPEQLELMYGLLRKAGYFVFMAGDGHEALAIAKREQPDIVISDVAMPELDGIEFCRLIRRDDELRSVPILLVSALRKDTDSVIEGLEAGADDYLEMPFDSSRLVAKVSKLVERARLEGALRDSEERYRLLFENTPQPIWVHDVETLDFLAVNESTIRTYGYSRQEFF